MEIKDVQGYEGEYTIREDGQVFSIKSGKPLKQQLNKRYLEVVLCKNSKQKHFYVHRLVASHFIGPIPKGMEVNHIDHDRMNNSASNLEICTPSENMKAFAKHKSTRIAQKHLQKSSEPNLRKSTKEKIADDFCKCLNEYKGLIDGYHQLLEEYLSRLMN